MIYPLNNYHSCLRICKDLLHFSLPYPEISLGVNELAGIFSQKISLSPTRRILKSSFRRSNLMFIHQTARLEFMFEKLVLEFFNISFPNCLLQIINSVNTFSLSINLGDLINFQLYSCTYLGYLFVFAMSSKTSFTRLSSKYRNNIEFQAARVGAFLLV